MYKIRFDCQTEAGTEDYESCSIVLTKEQYAALPELSIKDIDSNTTFTKKVFYEQVRHPRRYFQAIWLSNPIWQLEQPKTRFEEQYANPEYHWVLVCIDESENAWIAFKYWNGISNGEKMEYSSVGVSYPWHGEVYRIDESIMAFVRCFH